MVKLSQIGAPETFVPSLKNKLARLARSVAFFNRGTVGRARVARQLRTEIRIAEMPDNHP
jgi:hypothetical protein